MMMIGTLTFILIHITIWDDPLRVVYIVVRAFTLILVARTTYVTHARLNFQTILFHLRVLYDCTAVNHLPNVEVDFLKVRAHKLSYLLFIYNCIWIEMVSHPSIL